MPIKKEQHLSEFKETRSHDSITRCGTKKKAKQYLAWLNAVVRYQNRGASGVGPGCSEITGGSQIALFTTTTTLVAGTKYFFMIVNF